MRLNLSTDITSRDGSLSKDSKMQNCFQEGEEMFKRPAANSALATASGQGQGGVESNSLVFMINGDSLRSYNSSYTLVATISL